MKKHTLLLFMIALATTAFAQGKTSFENTLEEMASQMATDLLRAGKKRVAVTSFLNAQLKPNEAGNALAEEFSALLFSKKLTVIDRSRLDVLMNENAIGAQSLVKPSEVAKLGRLAGVQVVITGLLSQAGANTKLVLKGIDVEEATVIAAATGIIESVPSASPCSAASDCDQRSLGGICVTNQSRRPIEISFVGVKGGPYMINPGQTEGTNQIPIQNSFKKVTLFVRGDGRKTDHQSVSVKACEVKNVVIN
ncbi:MAG: FlgO family outer membrane protein [Spirosomataceae bacterium]